MHAYLFRSQNSTASPDLDVALHLLDDQGEVLLHLGRDYVRGHLLLKPLLIPGFGQCLENTETLDDGNLRALVSLRTFTQKWPAPSMYCAIGTVDERTVTAFVDAEVMH